MLRIENGKVQEHWDYAQKAKGGPTGGAPDGIDYEKVTFNHSAQEKKNLEIATVEFKDILQYGHVELAEKVMAPTYIQHNPNVPTGRAAFVEFFSRIRKPEPIQAGWKNKPTLMFASGSYVFLIVKRAEKDPDDPSQDLSGLLVRHGARGQRDDPGALGRRHEERAAGAWQRSELEPAANLSSGTTKVTKATKESQSFFVIFVIFVVPSSFCRSWLRG